MGDDHPLTKWASGLDEAWDAFGEAIERNDLHAQGACAIKMKEITDQIQNYNAAQLAEVQSLIDDKTAATEDGRVATLLRAFRQIVIFNHTLSDEIGDKDVEPQATKITDSIVQALDAIPPGRRTALLPFLDDENPDIRSSAAAYFLKTMPEGAVPVLREIKRTCVSTCAGKLASTVLFMYEHGFYEQNGI